MRRTPLTNVTRGQLVFPALRDFDFAVGETKRASPAQLSHPTVAPYVGHGLTLGKMSVAAPKVEPKAPVSPPPEPPAPEEPETEPTASTPDEGVDEEPNEGAGETLRDKFVAAPGITDSNVDSIMEAYPTLDALANASKSDFIALGVSKSYAKKLVTWARK